MVGNNLARASSNFTRRGQGPGSLPWQPATQPHMPLRRLALLLLRTQAPVRTVASAHRFAPRSGPHSSALRASSSPARARKPNAGRKKCRHRWLLFFFSCILPATLRPQAIGDHVLLAQLGRSQLPSCCVRIMPEADDLYDCRTAPQRPSALSRPGPSGGIKHASAGACISRACSVHHPFVADSWAWR